MQATTEKLRIEGLLCALRRGEDSAADELLRIATERFRVVASRTMFRFPAVRRWEDTGDIMQESMLKLHAALVKSELAARPESEVHFYRLVALQIRRVVIQCHRRHRGPRGFAANHDTAAHCVVHPLDGACNEVESPSLDEWALLHATIEALPALHKEAWDLRWYGGKTAEETAKIWKISIGSARRRWRQAQIAIAERLNPDA